MARRSVASATLSFGLVAIPVKFFLTAQAENVHFNAITKDGNRVNQIWVDAVTREEVGREDTRKGYAVSKDEYVIFTAEELKALGEDTGGSMEIVEFIPASDLDMLHVEKSYYLDAGKGGDKAYRLLVAALKKQGKLAVAQWTARGRVHLIVIGPREGGLVAYQMYYDAEVRSFELDCATYAPKDAEVDMACRLIDQLSVASFDSSKYTNTYNERVLAAVEAKRTGKTMEPGVTVTKPVGDLFAQLMASVKASDKKAS